MKEVDVSSLEHTSWRCQYHVVFAPRYRRMEIYGKIKEDIGVILCKLCQQKGVEIIEAQACPDHIHMLISIPPKYSVSQIMGYLKGKSSLSDKEVQSTQVGDICADFYQADGEASSNMLVWSSAENDLVFYIMADIPESTMIKMAEGVQKK